MKFGSQSEINKIKSILLKNPESAYIADSNIDNQWEQLNYLGKPDYNKCLTEYSQFISFLKQENIELFYLPKSDDTGMDSIYTHDPVVITNKGAILSNMGKKERKGEPKAIAKYLSEIGVPILGEISGEGSLEGGDIVWLDEKTLAVGSGYRTNEEGISQLKELTKELVDEFIVVPLPHWTGAGDCLHLMSNISPVDDDLAVVYSRLLTVPFRNLLIEKGIDLVEVPDSEYESMACNVLAIAPRKCVMIAGNPITKQRLEDKGVEVLEYSGEDISRKGAGGPTCLTRPLLREND